MGPPKGGAARALAAAALAAALAACGGGVDSPDPSARARAVRALAAERGDRPAAALLVAQRDPSPRVRLAAAETIAARRGPHAAEALGAMLADGDAAVAAAAAAGLAGLGDLDAARPALVEGYPVASPAGRVAIAAALAQIGISLRDAVEAEARWLWRRNLAALASDAPGTRAGAAEELGASGRAEAVSRLLAFVERPTTDRATLAGALRGLGLAGDLAARPALERFLAQGDPELAQAAAGALAQLGDPEGAAPLARTAASGSGPVALAALEALEALPNGPLVAQSLCGVAQHTPVEALAGRAARDAWSRNADCPASAVTARASRGEPQALAALIELRPGAAEAEPIGKRLLSLLADPRSAAASRRRAAEALGRLGWAGAAGPVEERARALAARIAAARSAWIPGRFSAEHAELPRDPQARLALLLARPPAVPSHDPGVAAASPPWIDPTPPADAAELGAVLGAIGRLHSPDAGALLREAARDPSPSVRAGAVEGLGFAGGEAPPAEVVSALAAGSAEVREAAAHAVARYGPHAIPALSGAVEAAGPSDAPWQATLARALGETGAAAALQPLATLLDGAAPGAAASAIGALGVAGGAEPLLARLARTDASARVEAIEALGQLAPGNAGPALEAELLSERPEVRSAAARVLGRLRWEPASRRLEALRVDYDARVRRAAIEALAKLPSGRPGAR